MYMWYIRFMRLLFDLFFLKGFLVMVVLVQLDFRGCQVRIRL